MRFFDALVTVRAGVRFRGAALRRVFGPALGAALLPAVLLRFRTHANACHNHRECRHRRELGFCPHRPSPSVP
jgi:hypothetical protein